MTKDGNHWNAYQARWQLVEPPLRPTKAVTAKIVQLADVGKDDPVLLWGVTPELASCFRTLDAVDKSEEMVRTLWPGDTLGRTATAADWLAYPLHRGHYRAIVGDGSFNSVGSAETLRRLLAKGAQVLAPGGRIICRTFMRPPEPVQAADLNRVMSGETALNFHAFKWMLAMRLAEEGGLELSVDQLRAAFNALCPDRQTLSLKTGWPVDVIDTIDVYSRSKEVFLFPSRDEIKAALPLGATVAFHECGGYDLADCCPILSVQFG
jgi:SAM-dependent methyltransferase